ncbi:MAG: nucleotide sugar dehydrogenase [Candidatus Bathyarchaeia archaeon]
MKIRDMPREEVAEAIRNGKVTIAVVGLGYVGLPLAVLFASEGAKVIGCVRTEGSAERINRGEVSITEFDTFIFKREGAAELEFLCDSCGVNLLELSGEVFCPYCGRLFIITHHHIHKEDRIASSYQKIVASRQDLSVMLNQALKSGKLYATTDTTHAVKKSDVVMITVGSPIDEEKIPNLRDLENACHSIGKGLQRDTLVIFKSTVPPGTTENLVKPILEMESKLRAGEDFQLAYMPETIYEGQAISNFRSLPKIVGGITIQCAQTAANVFSIFNAPIHIYDSPSIVEAAKLFMNIYRDVNIALVNELALICEKIGIDVTKAINAANVEKKTHLLTPGLVGGYCLPKDTYHLVYPAMKAGYQPKLITLARQLNDSMPTHILDLVDDAFKEMNIPIKNSRVAILGLGFKANSGDLRSAPSIDVVNGLLNRKANLIAHDPFVEAKELQKFLPTLNLTRDINEALNGASCAIIVTDHLEYQRLTAKFFKEKMATPCAIVDARHIIDPREAKAVNMVFRGLGKPY